MERYQSWFKLYSNLFFALAPMEDVTDVAFRQTLVKFGSVPHIFFTEFTNIDGLILGLPQVFHRLLPVPKIMGIPTIAQIWGQNIQGFKQAVPLILSMGYWGIDLNMGCPVKNVIKKGLGAGLSNNPGLAKQIINATYKAFIKFIDSGKLLQQWQSILKQNIESTSNFIEASADIPTYIKQKVLYYLEILYNNIQTARPTFSIKTRITVNKEDRLPDKWLEFLAQFPLDILTIHFRTGPEQSKVPAHWEIAESITEQIKSINPRLSIMGNGDIETVYHALFLKKTHKLKNIDGFMIGRGIFKDPLLFKDLWDVNNNKNNGTDKSINTSLLLKMFDYHINIFCRVFKSHNVVEIMQKLNFLLHEPSTKKVLARPLIKSQQGLKKFVKTY